MELHPSFSPDGNYVAYIDGPGRYDSDVYIKQIGSDSVRRLTSRAEKDVSPKWSPDGRHVAFVRLLKLQHPLAVASVMTAPVLGGSERKVTDTSVTIANASVVEWFLDWFPEPENLIVVDGSPGGGAGALFGVNIRTGEKWRLTSPPTTGMGDLDPAVAPDGRNIVFTRHTGTELSAELYFLRLNSQLRPAGQPTSLLSPTPSRGPVWTPDGREILFASGPRHCMRLWRMRVSRFQYRNRFRSALKEHSRIFQDRKVFSSSVTTIRTETRLCNAAHSCAVAEAAWWGTIKMIQEITSVRITDVWAALGGGPLRQRRGQAFWRDGDGYNVSLNDDKGCWHDFRYGKVAAFSILSRQ